jgi:6-phosphogluconate dehydrogenase (decarboxylating)
MYVGLIGLGHMGSNMAHRWRRHGHAAIGFARTAASVDKLVADGAIDVGVRSLADLVAQLDQFENKVLSAMRWRFGGHLELPMGEK